MINIQLSLDFSAKPFFPCIFLRMHIFDKTQSSKKQILKIYALE